MAARKPAATTRKASPEKTRPGLLKRTPLMEWIAAGLGLVLTLAVLGYSLWEGLTDTKQPPTLALSAGAPVPDGARFVLPLTVRNVSSATASGVQVTGSLALGDRVVETRRATFQYVPGQGKAKGWLVFDRDPRRYRLELTAEGYEEP